MTNKNDWEDKFDKKFDGYWRGEALSDEIKFFFRAEIQKSILAERERIDGILEGMKVDEFNDLPSTNVLESRMLKNLVVSQAQEKLKEVKNNL